MNLKFKKWIYACLTTLSIIPIKNANAQCVELINNGGFETISTTPTGLDQLNRATGWYKTSSTNNTPDLFSVSSTTASQVSIPCNALGYQQPHSGNAYAGIYHGSSSSNNWAWAEGIGYSFPGNMANSKIYEVSFWISKADLSNNNFDNLRVDIGPSVTYTISPTLTTDNVNWVLISFSHCADGSEDAIRIYSAPLSESACTTTITSGCSYTAAAGAYIYIDDVSVKEAKFTVPSQTVCLNSTFTLTAATQSTACPVTMSNYTYTWSHGDGTSAVNTGTNNTATYSYTAYGTYTGSLSVSSGACAVTYTYNVFVPNVPITITTNTATICNGTTNFTATPSGSYSYSWTVQDAATGTVIPTSNYTITAGTTHTPSINFGSINQNVNVCVSLTNTMGCTFSQCLFLPSCCPTPTGATKYSNKTFTTTTTILNTTYGAAFGGTITVNTGVTLQLINSKIQMDPNTKFIINGTGKLTIANCYVYACNAMWDGIYPLGTNTVVIRDSRIEDAQRVLIDSLGGAVITFTNNYINKNYQGIVLKTTKTITATVTANSNLFTCSSIPTPTAQPWVPTALKPNLTNAPTLGAYTSTVLIAPYNTKKSLCGVYMLNASQTSNTITIGASTSGTENVFDKLQAGALIDGSVVSFQNNVFQNIKSSIAPASGLVGSCGILTFYLAGGSPSLFTNVGGAVALKNTFINNDYGIYNTGKTIITASYNKFETQDQGIYVTNNSNNSTVSLASNKFVNNRIGINFNANTLINANVSINWFDNTTAQGDINNNFAIRFTEAVPATNFTSYAKYEAFNNYINGYRNGIYVNNTYSSKIKDNEVHLRPDNTAGTLVGGNWLTQSGIRIESTNTNDVFNNLVDMPSSNPLNWGQFGILTGLSSIVEIHCNYINYLGTSMVANSLNNTAAGKGIYGNSMNNTSVGFWLNGEIGGDQYYFDSGTNYSADNSWSNCPVETNVNTGCNSGGYKFYTRSTNPYKINNPTGSGNLLLGTNNSIGFTNTCYGSAPTPTLNLKLIDGTPTLPVMQNANDIALNTITYGSYNQSMQYMAQKQLFENLILQPTQPNAKNNNSTGSFMDNCKQNNIGTFYTVDSLINTGDTVLLNKALQLNNALTAVNLVDVAQQQVNQIYIPFIINRQKAAKLNFRLTNNEIIALENIATLCPNNYGDAVFQARSMLFNTTKLQYSNACEMSEDDANARKASTTSLSVSQKVEVTLYPNPSNGNITFQTNNDLSYNITVYNLLGEKVFESNISNKQNINLHHLSSATYIVHIINNGSLIKTERISIVH
jgi:hypothetical protein